MEQKINIAEILKDCPTGMELDCTMYDNVTLIQVQEDNTYPIKIETPDGSTVLTKYGGVSYNELSKCIIFPKGKTTWEGFVPPCKFKDGDVVVSRFGDIHLLRTGDSSYCAYRMCWTGATKLDNTITTSVEVARLATEEEKQILFDSIKANGYKWNPETKTLEKLAESSEEEQVGMNELGMMWQKQELIKKACKYLDINFPNTGHVGSWYKEGFIKQFKKAMEE